MSSYRKTGRNTWVSNVIQSGEYRRPERGTCPRCKRLYVITKDDTLRRHGTGRCLTDSQLPEEIVSAVILIANLDKE